MNASLTVKAGRRESISPVVTWQNRIVMAVVTLIFGGIGLKAILTPVPYASGRGILLSTAQGVTDMRAAEGGFPLAIAAILVYCLLSQKRYTFGLLIVAFTAGIVLLARLLGTALDHSLNENVRLIVPETVITAMAVVGLFLRRKAEALSELT